MPPGLMDTLNSSDTGGLRNKYYDYLSSSLDSPTANIGVDEGDAVFQGIVPTLAAAIFSKGGSFGFSGGPIQDWLKQQEETKKSQAILDLDTKTKRAALIGDELGRRDKIATDEWEQIRDEDLKRDLNTQTNETRKEVAEMNNATRQDTADERKSQRDAAASSTQATRLQSIFDKKAKALGIDSKVSALQDIKTTLNQGNSLAQGQLPAKLAKLSGEVGRLTEQDITRSLPGQLANKVVQLQNYLSSTTNPVLTASQIDAIGGLVTAYESKLGSQITNIVKEIETKRPSIAPSVNDEDFNAFKEGLGFAYGLNSDGGGSMVDDSQIYTSPNGTKISGADLKKRYTPEQLERALKTGQLK